MMLLGPGNTADERARHKIVRADFYTDVPGDIIWADEATGKCRLKVMVPKADNSSLEEKEVEPDFPCGIRIVRRAR